MLILWSVLYGSMIENAKISLEGNYGMQKQPPGIRTQCLGRKEPGRDKEPFIGLSGITVKELMC